MGRDRDEIKGEKMRPYIPLRSGTIHICGDIECDVIFVAEGDTTCPRCGCRNTEPLMNMLRGERTQESFKQSVSYLQRMQMRRKRGEQVEMLFDAV
jgi:hypothetical protein